MVSKRVIKGGIAGAIVAAVAIGLGVGIGMKGNSNGLDSSNAEGGGGLAADSAVDCVEIPIDFFNSSSGEPEMSDVTPTLAPVADPADFELLPGGRRTLRRQLMKGQPEQRAQSVKVRRAQAKKGKKGTKLLQGKCPDGMMPADLVGSAKKGKANKSKSAKTGSSDKSCKHGSSFSILPKGGSGFLEVGGPSASVPSASSPAAPSPTANSPTNKGSKKSSKSSPSAFAPASPTNKGSKKSSKGSTPPPTAGGVTTTSPPSPDIAPLTTPSPTAGPTADPTASPTVTASFGSTPTVSTDKTLSPVAKSGAPPGEDLSNLIVDYHYYQIQTLACVYIYFEFSCVSSCYYEELTHKRDDTIAVQYNTTLDLDCPTDFSDEGTVTSKFPVFADDGFCVGSVIDETVTEYFEYGFERNTTLTRGECV